VKDSHPFIRSLYELARREDRAALAELRRSFASPLAAMPYVVPYLGKDGGERDERALALVGGLFALHPSAGSRSLADALRAIAATSDSVALRFRALLDAAAEDLPVHLRHAVALARSHEIPLDYDDLLLTVRFWGDPDKRRQRAWARDFWATRQDESDSEAKDATP
jgi:CRISPR type I-E-associated protein CasB/Cse2